MKTLSTLVVLVVVLVAATSASRKCKYNRQDKWSECENGKQTATKIIKEGSDKTCPQKKVKTRICVAGEKCKYEKNDWSECNEETSLQTRTMNLKTGSARCAPVKTITRKCKKGCRYDYKTAYGPCDETTYTRSRVISLKKAHKGVKCEEKLVDTYPCKACKYQKGNWSECDPATKKMTRTLTLIQGSDQCPPNKTRLRRCRKGKSRKKACKYNRGPWSQCDPVTNKMQRTMTLKRGDRDACDPIKKVTRQCRRRAALSAARIHTKCKYEFADWQQCDLRTNTMTRTMNLVQGDPDKCAPTKELKRKCRKPCKFRKGGWSACDPTTHLMTRMDTLIKGDNMFCSKKRQITKKCKKGKRKCQYDIGEWSECDTSTNKRTRVKKLKKGDLNVCKPEIAMTKSCSRPNGKERCFFGKWGEYLPCMNGVMTKARELIQGGTECERKAVKTKACS